MQSNEIMKKPTNEEIIERYIERFKHSKDSQDSRRTALRYFKKNSDFKGHLFEIETDNLTDYFDFLNNEESIGFGSKKYRWAILRGLMIWINEYYRKYFRYYKLYPIIIPKTNRWSLEHKETNSNKDVIATREELEQILRHLKEGNERNYLMFRLLIETGMRVGELASIQVLNINTEKRFVKVSGKRGKGVYYFTESLAEKLDYYINHTPHLNKYLFPSHRAEHYTARAISMILSHIREEIGIKKHISAHTFRRTLNTYRFEMLIIDSTDPLKVKDDIRLKILLNHKVKGVNFESYTKLNYEHFLSMYDTLNPYKKLNF